MPVRAEIVRFPLFVVDAAVHDDASALHADSASVFGSNIFRFYYYYYFGETKFYVACLERSRSMSFTVDGRSSPSYSSAHFGRHGQQLC